MAEHAWHAGDLGVVQVASEPQDHRVARARRGQRPRAGRPQRVAGHHGQARGVILLEQQFRIPSRLETGRVPAPSPPHPVLIGIGELHAVAAQCLLQCKARTRMQQPTRPDQEHALQRGGPGGRITGQCGRVDARQVGHDVQGLAVDLQDEVAVLERLRWRAGLGVLETADPFAVIHCVGIVAAPAS